MRLGQVLAVGALALVEVGHGVEAEAVEAEVEPEAQDVEHRLLDLGVVEVEVGLVGEEAVPVVGAGLVVPGPVRRLGVGEDDPRVLVACATVSDQTYQSRSGEPGGAARAPGTTRGRDEVWFMTRSAITRMPRWWAASMNVADVLDRPVVGVDRRRSRRCRSRRRAAATGVHRQQPDAVDAEPLQVVELLGQPAEVAGAVAVAVEEAAQCGSRRRPPS